jgi:hypothetical protein
MRKTLIYVALAAALAAPAAFASQQIWAGAAASNAVLDSGIVNTSNARCVLVAIRNTGTAVSGACTVSMVRNDGTTHALGPTFTVTNGQTSYAGSVCPGVGTGFGFSAPVPRRVQVSCVGALNAVLTAVIEGG